MTWPSDRPKIPTAVWPNGRGGKRRCGWCALVCQTKAERQRVRRCDELLDHKNPCCLGTYHDECDESWATSDQEKGSSPLLPRQGSARDFCLSLYCRCSVWRLFRIGTTTRLAAARAPGHQRPKPGSTVAYLAEDLWVFLSGLHTYCTVPPSLPLLLRSAANPRVVGLFEP